MKIEKVAYKDGFAWFVMEGDTKHTYGVKLSENETMAQVKKTLKDKIELSKDTEEKTFDDLKLMDLIGTDL